MSVRVSIENARGCGHRKAGGLYLMGGNLAVPCGRMPLALHPCPTCGHGLKQQRGIQMFRPREYWGVEDCVLRSRGDCGSCSMSGAMPETAAIMWIGVRYYPTPSDFLAEAREVGISKRIAAVPHDIAIGETRVYLAHPKGTERRCSVCNGGFLADAAAHGEDDDCPGCGGDGIVYEPAVIASFVPTGIEKVIDEVDAEAIDRCEKDPGGERSMFESEVLDQAERDAKRGIEYVRVIAEEDVALREPGAAT